MRRIGFVVVAAVIGLLLSGCGIQKQTRSLTLPEQVEMLDRSSSYLKVHLTDGNVYILHDWHVDDSLRTVSGQGKLLDLNRNALDSGVFAIPIDSVAVFETNRVGTSPAISALTIVTLGSVAMTIYCIANPKACFGSCPTFYVAGPDSTRPQAEGFSASVAPALEASDIDALYRVRPTQRRFEIEMRNEALETHVVRYADLLVARRPFGSRVIASSDGTFWPVSSLTSPSTGIAGDGDCLNQIIEFDGLERLSVTDSSNLATKEIIDLTFAETPPGDLGLIIACRQSLLSTYLFYQGLAYLGQSVPTWMAALERGDNAARYQAGGIGRLLGGIEILVRDETGEWMVAGEVNETGPLATDVHLVRLPEMGSPPKNIRLRLTKGHWRLDWLALAAVGAPVSAQRLKPSAVWYDSLESPTALQTLLDTSQTLTTFPGDNYRLIYELPEDYDACEIFLESRGYYLEWMRQEWLAEENMARAASMFFNPAQVLVDLAPQFKAVEGELEEMFWSSRYVR